MFRMSVCRLVAGWSIPPGVKERGAAMPLAMTMTLRIGTETHRPEPGSDLQLAVVRALAHRCRIPEKTLEARPRPYTLAPFQGREASGRTRATHGSCRSGGGSAAEWVRLRVSWLDDTHLETLLRRAPVTPEEPFHVTSGNRPVRIEAVSVQPSPWDPWTRWDAYGDLFSSASESLRTATLRFCSPTVLLRGDTHHALPDPNVIFPQYLELWNLFSGIPLDKDLAQVLKQDLVITGFRLRARPAGHPRTVSASFSGSATFGLRVRQPETVLKGFNALADFAFYCGTGAETDHGMGLTRRVFPAIRNPEDGPRPQPGFHARHEKGRTVR